MSNLVIVAIPDENERVWKVSSEKVPHLSLLFLGETDQVSNLEQIVLFVEHAASTLNRFMMSVDRRGELGADQADVLFFKKTRYDYKAVREFRAALLQDSNIRMAYDTATQFDGPWNPHLTLGYPDTPAKKDKEFDDYGFYSVDFNKIAVWTEDFDGPEFLLKDHWDEYEVMDNIPMDVAMSDIQHYGVRGMKWGVRKARDARFRTSRNSLNTVTTLVNGATALTKTQDLPKINEKYAAKGAKTSGTPHLHSLSNVPVQKAYRNEVREAYRKRLEEYAASMTNASGTRRYEVTDTRFGPEGSPTRWKVKTRAISHAIDEELDTDFEVEPIFDEDGFITDIRVVEESLTNSMAQTVDLGAEFLAHYGVKGMRWGVRNDPKSENKNAGWLDPEGKNLSSDVIKAVVWPLVPPLGIFAAPAQVRLTRASARAGKAKAVDVSEKRFAKKAQSEKNFVAIHNGASPRINKDIDTINAKYPDISKPATKKKYDDEIMKSMQDAYRESANSIGNKPNTMHLDLEFKNDGLDFLIKARQGAATPKDIQRRVEHAATDEDVVTFGGKIERAPSGHIIGLEFDDFKHDKKSMAQSDDSGSVLDLGATFILEHYGVKGMHWGVRRGVPEAVSPTATSRVPHGKRRKTKIKAEGGESHPAHTDAIKVAESRIKLKKSGAAALSNQELRDVANRLQLESQVKQLTASKGRRFVRGEIDAAGQGKVTPGRARGTRALKLVI